MSIDLKGPGLGAPLIPGTYERNTLTYRQPGSMGAHVCRRADRFQFDGRGDDCRA